MLFRRSVLCTPFQFMSSYLIESLQIAFRLDSESDSITRLSISFCLSASRIAPNSALELDAYSLPCVSNFSAMFQLLPSVYHTPIPVVAFSHPFWIADLSVFSMT